MRGFGRGHVYVPEDEDTSCIATPSNSQSSTLLMIEDNRDYSIIREGAFKNYQLLDHHLEQKVSPGFTTSEKAAF